MKEVIGSVLILLLVVASAKNHEQPQKYRLDYIKTLNYKIFETGDIIFRGGNSALSQTVVSLDSKSQFSHVGLVHLVDNKPFIIHASLGDSANAKSRVIIEPLEAFLKKEYTLAVGIYRLRRSSSNLSKKASAIAQEYVSEGILFDSDFDLKTSDKLYCTELIWRAYKKAGIDLVDNQFDHSIIPFTDKLYLLPSRLQHSRFLQEIYSLNIGK